MAFHSRLMIETRETKSFIIQERDLAYRFYLHQHPYVQPFIQRLLRKGTKGLQATDTEYNTRIRLTTATAAKDSYGKPVQLAAEETLYLLDGATDTVNGDAIRFAGSKVLKLLDGSSVTFAANQAATISRKTIVSRSGSQSG